MLDPPSRLLFRIQAKGGERHAVQVFVHGSGRTHRKRVDRIEIRGIGKGTKVEIQIPDFRRQDQTGLLPLWAGIPDKEQAERLVRQTVLRPDKFWREFGIPTCRAQDRAYQAAPAATVAMMPNLLIGEGLVDYGYMEEAAELVAKLMRACIASLKQEQAFREAYHADRPGGLGGCGHLAGVAPLSLLLYVLGVWLMSPSKIALRGHNPFPWPIALRWRGVEIRWTTDRALLKFPDGGEAEVIGRLVQTVEQALEDGVAIITAD